MQSKNKKYNVLKVIIKNLLKRKAALVFVSTVVIVGGGCAQLNPPLQNAPDSAGPQASDSRTNSPETNQNASDAQPSSALVSFAPVVKRAAPSVVTIQSARRARAPQQFPFAQDPRFREFFGDTFGNDSRQEQQPRQMQRGLGSGVIVSQDGYILTNHHVIDGAEEIKIGLNDRRTFDAKVVDSDPLMLFSNKM